MQRTEIGRVAPGGVYRFHQLRALRRDGQRVVDEHVGGLYRVEGFALDLRTRHDVVLVRGLEGPEAGEWFVCSLAAFALAFRPEPQAEAAPGQPPAPPEKSISVTEGSGF